MKKNVIFMLMAMFAILASASNFPTNKSMKPTMCSRLLAQGHDINPLTKASKSAVIYEQPEGEMKIYTRTGGGIFFDGSGLQVGSQGGKAYIVWGEGNKVYLKHPVYGLPLDVWVEGVQSEDGTKITVPLGQTIYVDPEDGTTLDLCWGSSYYGEFNEEFMYLPIEFIMDESVTEAVYTIDGSSIRLEGSVGDIYAPYPENAVMTGLSAAWSDTKQWEGCLDCGTVYTERPYIEPLPVITEQPEGELVEYQRSGESVIITVLGSVLAEQEGKSYVVYGDNGKVYLKDPLYGSNYGSWIEGTLSKNGITIPLGQCIYWDNEADLGLIIQNVTMDIDKDGKLTFTNNESVTEITFTIDGNKIIMNNTSGSKSAEWPTQMTGLGAVLSNNMSYGGYLNWNTVYNKVMYTPVIPADPSLEPADIGQAEAWYDSGNEDGYSLFHHHIKLEDVDGNPLEAKNLSYSIFTDDDQLFTFDAATYNYDLMTDMTELPYELNGKTLDSRTTHFYRTNVEGFEPFFKQRIGIQVYYTIDGVKNASNIVYYELPAESGVPANPTADEWYDCGNESGYSKFLYTISNLTTDGKRMDPSRVYYSIFTDEDQLFTFHANEYFDIYEDKSLIPYKLNGIEINNNYSYFYHTNAEGYEPFFKHQIGIQVYYLCSNGEMTASDIVYLEVFEPGSRVDEVNAVKSVADVKYYNMAGQEMIEANGICIAVTRYTDGTTNAVKVVR